MDLRSITNGEFSEETPFKIKTLGGVVLLDGADFTPPWSLIFETQWVRVQPDGTGVVMHTPRALVHLSDINEQLSSNGPLSGLHMLEISGVTYPIMDDGVQDDADGLAYVELRKAVS